MTFALLVEQIINGLQLGIILFLVAAGLTLIFGIMDLVNLAHGTLYMFGAFFAATMVSITGSIVWGMILAIPLMLLAGVLLEVTILRTLYTRNHLDQVLATFGLILFFNELFLIAWGPKGLELRCLHGFLDRRNWVWELSCRTTESSSWSAA